MNTEQFNGHTPGPWYLNTPDPNPARTVRFISDVCTDLLGASDADARLIAAAPDLLAALIKEREENLRLRHQNAYLWEHRSSHWSAEDDAEMDRLEAIE